MIPSSPAAPTPTPSHPVDTVTSADDRHTNCGALKLKAYLDSTRPSGSGPAVSASHAVCQAEFPGYSALRR